MNITSISDLYRELIGESTKQEYLVKPYIEFIKFDPEEILEYKKKEIIHIIRPFKDIEKFTIGTYVKPEWGTIYKVEDRQIINSLEDWKYFNELSLDKIKKLNKHNTDMYLALTLVHVTKKNVKRIFYDCEFDEVSTDEIQLISIGMVDEEGNELYLVNKDYNWEDCKNQWLIDNIKQDIIEAPDYLKVDKTTIKKKILEFINPLPTTDIKLYGYYSAYDHVCLSKIFGTMKDLPKEFPMYTKDLQQFMDYFNIDLKTLKLKEPENEHNALSNAKWNKELYTAIKEKFGNSYI